MDYLVFSSGGFEIIRSASHKPVRTSVRAVDVALCAGSGKSWRLQAAADLLSESDRTAHVQIMHVADHGVHAKKPLPIAIEYCGDDEYVAKFEPADVSISGESARDALNALKSQLAWMVKDLGQEESFGPRMREKMKILGDYLGPESDKQVAR